MVVRWLEKSVVVGRVKGRMVGKMVGGVVGGVVSSVVSGMRCSVHGLERHQMIFCLTKKQVNILSFFITMWGKKMKIEFLENVFESN